MSDERPVMTTTLHERDHDPLANNVTDATCDTDIVLHCPGCETYLRLGSWTGPYQFNLPWLASLCPTCGARFRVVSRIEITWQAAGEDG